MAKGPPLGVRLDDEVRKGLEAVSEKEERSLSFLINRICKEWLVAQAATSKKPRRTK